MGPKRLGEKASNCDFCRTGGSRSRGEAPRSLKLDIVFIMLIILCLTAFVTVALPCSAQIDQGVSPTVHQETAYGQLPLYFVENRGQLDARVGYCVQGRDKTLYFTSVGITFALTVPAEGENVPDARPLAGPEAFSQRWIVKLDFLEANPNVQPVGRGETDAVISHFTGSPEAWKMGLRTYSRVVYPDLWPGIDLEFSGTVSELKYQFIVKPGADPGMIRLAYSGATAVEVNEAGQLEASTPVGSFHDAVPYAYQEVDEKRVEVAATYTLDEAKGETWTYGFDVGVYDPTLPLVLDPAVLLYCGYVGGSGGDYGEDIAVDDAGNAYVTGYTGSTGASFPVTVGPDTTYTGSGDVFVAKVNASGSALLYCGYIGGSGFDVGCGIDVDTWGNAYVTGYTDSTEASFPVTVGPGTTYNGSRDGFVAKVNTTGTALLYCGYVGGSGDDLGLGIAVDDLGNAYVSGYSGSTEVSFPVTVGPGTTHSGGVYDAFVAKVNTSGTALLYCGYVGGSSSDMAYGIDVDTWGNAYVTGSTNSTEASFPVTVGPDTTHNGNSDAFVAKVNAAGTGLVYCGYVGGSGGDYGEDIAVDDWGNAYVIGFTFSGEASFPVTVGPDTTYNGSTDSFVAKVNAAGTGLVYCGYIGGGGYDIGHDIAVDDWGNAYVTGYTPSTEASFPVTVGPDLTHNGDFDAFVAKVNATGAALVYCGYVGGNSIDQGHGIAVDTRGNAYVTGYTRSTEASFPVAVGPDLTHNYGLDDAFVAKIVSVPTKGDVDLNGVIDVLDVRLCLQIARGFIVGTAAQRDQADVDSGGNVDETDARAIAEFIIGLRGTLP
jgi:hypothetical protein